jgi:hypothetical protein
MTRAQGVRLGLAAMLTMLAGCSDGSVGNLAFLDASIDLGDSSIAPGGSADAGDDGSDDGGGSVFEAPPSDAGVELCSDPGADCPGVVPCADTAPTTLTGTVYDPAGKTPLYNAIVFIPSATPAAIVTGTTTCSSCSVPIANYVAATVTDDNGAFTLRNVPTGGNIPLVIQSGKWRRQVTLPNVPACTTTQVPADLTRLPRNQSEGDIPQMAVLTGACDGIACFMRRVGLDAQEFTGPDGTGRLHVYRGVGPGPDLAGGGGGTAGDCTGDDAGACPLWTTDAELERYDTVFLGCECGEYNQTKPDKTPMHDWLNVGGTVIAVHDQETWFRNGPADFQTVSGWTSEDASAPGPFVVDTSFANGSVFQSWLKGIGVLSPDGSVPLNPPDVSASMTGNSQISSRWIYDEADYSDAGAPVEMLSFRTPVGGFPNGGAAKYYCGRAILSDVHVGAGGAPSSAPVPESCDTGDLSPEEKALEFLLFSQSLCVAPTVVSPPPPLGD